MLGRLHAESAGWINRLDDAAGRQVWHNFWDTRLTYQKSFLTPAELRASEPGQAWSGSGGKPISMVSARWFERTASAAKVKSIYRFKIEAVHAMDDFELDKDW